MKSSRVAADANNRNTLPRRPNGYILSYGVSYTAARNEGKDWAALLACPPSASATHAAFVSKCGFSPTFEPLLDEHATKSRMLADVGRVAATVVSRDGGSDRGIVIDEQLNAAVFDFRTQAGPCVGGSRRGSTSVCASAILGGTASCGWATADRSVHSDSVLTQWRVWLAGRRSWSWRWSCS